MSDYTLLIGDALEQLRTLPANSVHCCVTSPPYFLLRSYLPADHPDKHLELGGEQTPEQYVARLVEVFREVRRVLHPSGQLFINISDTRSDSREWLGIPHRLVFALQADGWRYEDEVIWAKKAPMPGSQTNRFTRSHEYVFMLNKSRDAFFDGEAVKEPNTSGTLARLASGPVQSIQKHHKWQAVNGERRNPGADYVEATGRIRRSVWLLGPEQFDGSHYATFPTKLVEPMILSGSSAHGVCAACGSPWARVVERDGYVKAGHGGGTDKLANHVGLSEKSSLRADGMKRNMVVTGWAATCTCGADVVPSVVLDCFSGAATTGVVALKHGRRYIGIEINAEYVALSHKRLGQVQPLLMDIT